MKIYLQQAFSFYETKFYLRAKLLKFRFLITHYNDSRNWLTKCKGSKTPKLGYKIKTKRIKSQKSKVISG